MRDSVDIQMAESATPRSRAIAIRVAGLSKQYRLGAARHDTLRDQVAAGFRALTRRNGHRAPRSDRLWALRDVSFEIRQGETVGIIGLNGAGKSTLLKILSRITEPTEGWAEIRGRVGSLLEVGTGFHWELTGRENVYLYGAILGMRKADIERRFDRIVEFAEIEKHLDTPVKHYSSGMYVRLGFAVAAHLDPEILLVDEVLSVGDLSFQRKCMTYAKRLSESDATVLVVSHNMFAIKAMCKRVLYLSGGHLRLDGSPDEVIEFYERESRLETAPWAQYSLGTDPPERQILITDLRLLGEAGEPRSVFEYGERMRVRLSFEASERVVHPNFNVSFIRSDNVPCCNFNTAMDGPAIPFVEGKGTVELLTPPLKLVAESYRVHAMVWDQRFERLYTAQVGPTCHVRHETLNTHFGVFHEPAEWTWIEEPKATSRTRVAPQAGTS
jgi:homopolymeric O-antigen transport system ATP-binding protein